jgi:Protein of unknown function (DUF4231)
LIRLTRRKSPGDSQRIEALTEALLTQWSDYPEAKEYIRSQWAALLVRADKKSRGAQNLFYVARWFVIVGATIVPTLVVLGVQTHGTIASITQTAAAVLSLVVAAAAGALQVTQIGPRWLLNHQLRFELERAGAKLYLKRGSYADQDPKTRFAAFADDIERIMYESESSYSERIAQLGRDEGASN